jgi:hypothetical protein
MINKYQRGSALLFSLIILTVVTLLATSTMKTSMLEEKMASNTQFTQLAYLEARSEIEAQYQYLVWSDDELISGEVAHLEGMLPDTPITLDSRLEDTVGTNTITMTESLELSKGAVAGYTIGDVSLGYYVIKVDSVIASVNSSSSQAMGLSRPKPKVSNR